MSLELAPTPQRPRLGVPDDWYVACESRALRASPLAVELLGHRLVLFRDARGVARALQDRCSHRNVPLSMGRVCEGQVECPYHGWRFDGDGRCTHVPGLLDDDRDAGARGRAVPSLHTRESAGYVWVYSTVGVEPTREPFALPLVDDPSYTTVNHVQDFEGSVHAVAENALDVPHTAFVHRGLFRSGGETRGIDVDVQRFADRVEAEYIGEPRPDGMIGRLLSPGGGVVRHWDRFFLPCIAQVEYRLGEDSHVVATTALTPIAEHKTRMFASVSFRMPIPGRLVTMLKPIGLRILDQDVRILARQMENIRAFGGPRYASTKLDVLGPSIEKLLRTAERGDRGAPAAEGDEPARRSLRIHV
ncbi:MAG: aromatic ring-hydroxylating dioxygenase subunit alpha [Myxococcales bacterium]|nr:aromatic ring-hydroxylating dioxygenase subunit alpha [Myxococcales bacterium]MCB9628995.1 aromatic ring-hydroxylating dioxygenase subunit alpha [Sandaracinaceae bacterium]